MNRFSGIFGKKVLLGIGVFCVAAVTTIGALSAGGNNDEEPEQLADFNEQKDNENQQLADATQNPKTDGTGSEVAQVTPGADDTQVASVPETLDPPATVPDETKDVAEVTPDPKEEPPVVAEVPDPQDEVEVISPLVIAEQLSFEKEEGLLCPLEGEYLIPYSPDHSVYYSTLDQFATSEAVVIDAEVGNEVKAAAKGVVVSIEEDARTGTTVTLALGNNTSLVYGQINAEGLAEGDILEAGECLGTVAEPTKYYSMEGPNLYFQVLENEETLNPTELFAAERAK